jgi:hypothetical protein
MGAGFILHPVEVQPDFEILIPVRNLAEVFRKSIESLAAARLPICADSLLFCKLAARNGSCRQPRALVHFLIHAARFSDMLPGKWPGSFREALCYFASLGMTAWQERWRFPALGSLRLFARTFRDRFKS